MTRVLLSGAVFKAPESRTGKSGRPFATVTIKAQGGDTVEFWRVSAFSESARALLVALNEGDSVAIQGTGKFEIYTALDGSQKLSLSVVADQIMQLRAKAAEPQLPLERARGHWSAPDPDDPIPF